MEMAISRHGDILDIRDAAYVLRLRPAQVLAALERDTLSARRIGGEWRFERNALKDWVAAGSSARYTNPFFYRLTAFNLKTHPDIAFWRI
jgi:hypothetical protein